MERCRERWWERGGGIDVVGETWWEKCGGRDVKEEEDTVRDRKDKEGM